MSSEPLYKYILGKNKFPVVSENEILKTTLELMSFHRIGIALVCDEKNEVQAIFTDGDFRRLILSNQRSLPALLVTEMSKISNENFLYVDANTNINQAIEIMKKNSILNLPVLEGDKIVGLLDLSKLIELIVDKTW